MNLQRCSYSAVGCQMPTAGSSVPRSKGRLAQRGKGKRRLGVWCSTAARGKGRPARGALSLSGVACCESPAGPASSPRHGHASPGRGTVASVAFMALRRCAVDARLTMRPAGGGAAGADLRRSAARGPALCACAAAALPKLRRHASGEIRQRAPQPSSGRRPGRSLSRPRPGLCQGAAPQRGGAAFVGGRIRKPRPRGDRPGRGYRGERR
jgi:hypothetical protein